MKLYIRLKKWLTKHGAFWGVLFFMITGFNVSVYYPNSTTSVTGYIDNITIEKRYSSDKYKTHYYSEYIFHIKDKEYSKYIIKNENYDYLIGKEVKINYHPDRYNENDIDAIAYNNKVIFSMDEYMPRFIKWLVLFILSIVFCICLLVLNFRNTETTSPRSA